MWRDIKKQVVSNPSCLRQDDNCRILRLFLENLDSDTEIITHHTSALQVGGKFPENKKEMIDTLQYGIDHYDEFSTELNNHRDQIRTL